MSRVGDRLRQAIEGHEELSIRKFHEKIRETGVDGTAYATIHGYIAPGSTREPGLAFLHEAAEILDVREEWLVLGKGQPTRTREELSAPEEEGREDSLRSQIATEHPKFNTLSSATREVFMEVLADYASTAPGAGEFANTDEGRDHVIHLAGRLLFLLNHLSRGFGFKLPQHRRPREFNAFSVGLLNSLRPLLADPGEGPGIEHAYGDLLEVAREAIREKRKEVAEATEGNAWASGVPADE